MKNNLQDKDYRRKLLQEAGRSFSRRRSNSTLMTLYETAQNDNEKDALELILAVNNNAVDEYIKDHS